MDLNYGPEYEAFRAQLQAFLAANWPPKGEDAHGSQREQMVRFRAKGIEAGYLARGIPRAYGGSEQPADVLKAHLISEEFARTNAPLDRAGIITPTLLAHGTEWQKQRFVRPTLLGEIIWCQGYSEPGSGSDLASIQTRAELVGNEWIINGQKIWTSGARDADYIFALCRTEPDAPKHGGISYLLIDMHQPGIQIQPLKQMTGASGFNQVFFTDVRTPADWIVGKRGEGWQVSRTTLSHERSGIGNANGALQQFEALVRLAQRTQMDGRPSIEHPDIRQRLASLEGYVRSHQYSSFIKLSKAAKHRDAPLLNLMNKLLGTNIGHEVSKLSLDLLSDQSLVPPTPGPRVDAPRDNAGWVNRYMGSLGVAIMGGTSNIQRNVIAERGLGLPRDEAAQRSSGTH
jgi:alkylation response protein AidB-like acyl-CoA dehydrogenase